MKTVSTLCATGTVGVAAMGYVFGRPQVSTILDTQSTKRKAPTRGRESDPAGSTRGSPSAALSGRVRPASHHAVAIPSRDLPSADGFGQSHALEPTLITDFRQLDGRGQARRDPVSEQGSMASNYKGSSNSRNSWLQRLSTLSNSKNPSPTSSIGPDSPSVTFSHGSTVPMLHNGGKGNSDPLPPNKLVKRSSSHRALGTAFPTPPLNKLARVTTLRRPATSHQRSATLSQRYTMESDGENFQQEDRENRPPLSSSPDRSAMLPDKSISWRHYFKSTFVKRQKETHTIKRSAQTPRPTHFTFKQIRPDGRYQPTLLKPDSIGTAATDERPAGTPQSRDSDTFFFGSSRPTTPSRLSALFTPPQDEPSQPLKSAGPERQPRRSFSIADMFGSSPTSWVSRSHPSQSASTSRDKATQGRRNSSAPLTSVPSRLIMSAHGSRAGRRNITDPAFFQTDDPPPIPSSPRIQLAPRNAGTNVWDASVSHAQPIQKSHAYRTTLHNDARPQSRSPHLSGTPQPRLRLSLAASTLVGSDVEQRSSSVGDEGDFDFQSDTVFDSLRTGTTNYSTHGKGTNLESIFDETRQFRVSGQDSALPSSGQSSSGPDLSIPTMSDKDNVSLTTGREGELAVEPVFGTLATVRGNAAYDGNPPSSPPEINSARHTSPRNLTIPDREREYTRLSFDDDDDDDDQDWGRNDEDIEITSHLSSPQSVRRPQWTSPLIGPEETEGQRTGRLGSRSFATKDALTSLFGYSEQPPHDKSGGDASNERPKTVSGKNVSEGRGGRSHGRRGPSAMHVRSQSVPVLPDPHTTHENGVSGHPRYGTWGLGSKAINEDWNEDFDFGFPGGERAESSTEDCARAEIGSATMIVPRAIQERQESVIGHLSHVKEFALLVEDLKRLRTLAISKDIINGPTADMWKEAEGIIDLATLDEENQEAVPPQSPAFTNPGSDPFDEDSSPSLTYGRGRRKSVLSIEDDIFGGAVISPDSSADPTSKMSTPSSVRISGRPDRQDTSAIARSVIESIHQRRTTSDPALNPIDPNPQSKMPFDTTTLRDLVAHVSGLSRKLGDVVRRAESRSSSQAQSPAFSAPSVSQVLAESVSGSPSVSKTRLPRSQSSNGVIPGPIGSTDNDMGGHYSLMTVI